MTDKPVLVERRDSTLVITLNRPEARNALNPALAAGLVDAMQTVADDDGIRAVVVTGAGDKAFCAGMDLRAFAAGEDMAPVGTALHKLATCPKPVIAAINGPAVAGGFEVMLRCDLAVAADHALFGIPEVKRSLVAAGGGTRLPSVIPMAIALELGLTGDLVDAERALALGLINRVVPKGDELAAALELAVKISANGPLAVAATKQLMYAEIGGGNPGLVAELAGKVQSSEDAHEGATAFTERREPVWKGR